ncbi:glutamine amidotransferase [Lactococcus hodotermopsidis]|uniref:Glutamine amidotransferase n=1 Tax=Pseudolactococcus hodotermopsidis TaxID=2709157 RepID=A0A6A0B9S2_9LACT|nr:aminodeoxychorismate/anthranilate synthase component II [Lactococcus hodotermopsidis]GFH42200.1 glutamine amidotransferase [Lactococcus hodotermopsidis]
MILLVDNYDSFTYNLAQYIGEFADVKVLRNDDETLYDVADRAEKIVFSPGPGWPADAGRMEEMIRDFADKKPILGICLGHQAIAEIFGGKLDLAQRIMHGKTSIAERLKDTPLLAGIPKTHEIMRYHSIVISEMPAGFEILSKTTDDHEIMAIQHKHLPIFGMQYHPESIGTPEGLKMIENFVKL